jgi:probable phosphoglycerate mutase
MISSQFSTTSTQVILVRHARTTYNEQGRFQGSSDDSVLTEKGYQDAFLTGLALKKYNFDAIYTSPLMRVQQTTEAILNALKSQNRFPPVYTDSQLTEICMSAWQGLFYQEVKEKYATAYRCWQDTPHLFNFNDQVFPVLDLFNQAQQFWKKVLNQHRGQTILVVAHGGTNRALISIAMGLKPEYYNSLQQSNSGISHLKFVSDHALGKLEYLNITNHLGETLPKLKAGKTGFRWLLLSNAIAKTSVFYSNLKTIINGNSIDFILTDESVSNLWLDQLLGAYQTLRLSIPKNYSIQKWQQKFFEQHTFKNNLEKARLVTGFIVASEPLLSQILQNTLTFETSFNLENHLAIIHCPQVNRHSILQGILPLNEQLFPQLN